MDTKVKMDLLDESFKESCQMCSNDDLTSYGLLQDLNQIRFEDVPAVDVLNEMFRLKVEEFDVNGAPTKVCTSCLEKLSVCLELWTLAKHSHPQIKDEINGSHLTFIDISDSDITDTEIRDETKKILLPSKSVKGPFKCLKCGKEFRLRKAISQHAVIHEEPQYECTVCNKRFRQKSYLQNHIDIHVEGFKYTCETCGCGKKTKKALYSHKYKKHGKGVHQNDILLIRNAP